MAIARVQGVGSGTTTGASATGTAALTSVGTGHGLIVVTGNNSSTGVGTVSSVGDTHNTYSQVSGAANANSVNAAGDIWYCKNVGTGGSLTVTVTWSVATGGPLVMVIEVSGQDTTTFIDVAHSANGSSAAPNAGATASTTAANEFVIGAVVTRSAGAQASSPVFSTSLTSQTTEATTENSTTADKGDLTVFDGLLASSGVAETFSATIVSHPWVAMCATFLAATASNPITVVNYVVNRVPLVRASVF